VMLGVLSRLRGVPPPTVTREQALAVARAEFERRGGGSAESPRVEERLRSYIVWRYSGSGGNTGVEVDIHTGAVLRVLVRPR
jgi:hypothetical protein